VVALFVEPDMRVFIAEAWVCVRPVVNTAKLVDMLKQPTKFDEFVKNFASSLLNETISTSNDTMKLRKNILFLLKTSLELGKFGK